MERFGILAAIQRHLAEAQTLSAPDEASGRFTLQDEDLKIRALKTVIHDVLSEGAVHPATERTPQADPDPRTR